MTVRHRIFFITILIFLLSFSFLAADNTENTAKFVDLDGDGFDDNAVDNDNNSIPDQAEPVGEEVDQCGDSSPFVAFQVTSEVDLSQFLSNSEKFGERMFSTRAQSCFRVGFDAGDNFGFGNGIGSGAVTGGCPGGICH